MAVRKNQSTLTADEKRRLLLGAMIPKIVDPEQAGFLLMHMGTPVARSKDVPWLLKRQLEESDEARSHPETG